MASICCSPPDSLVPGLESRSSRFGKSSKIVSRIREEPLAFVISGAILVEYVFAYPGVGFMLLQAVQNEDYALMQALFLLITVAVLVAVLLADLVTAWLDPRTRAGL